MKSRTQPFTSKESATSFSKVVSGKITTQGKVHHVHYKSGGIYKGNNTSLDDSPDLDRDGTHCHDSSDV